MSVIRWVIVGVACLSICPSAFGQYYQNNTVSSQNTSARVHWSQSLTDVKSHDFGTVAKASAQQHVFRFTNTLEGDLQLSSIRASCGCIKPKILTQVVKPGETAEVLIDFDTKNFEGQRAATATLGLQRRNPHSEYAEIQFSIKGMIRRDVVIDPLTVDFGTVVYGAGIQRLVTVKYAGNPAWTVENVSSSNPSIEVAFEETRRDRNTGRVDYQIQLTVKPDAALGSINDHLLVTTSDLNNQNIRVPLLGHVKQAIQAAPVQLGLLTLGQPLEKSIVIKGDKPFEILGVDHKHQQITFKKPEGQKTLHLLQYTVDTSKAGLLNDSIIVKTSDPNQPEIVIAFDAQVVPNTFVVDPNKDKE